MKHLKKFENFDLGRFTVDDEEQINNIEDIEDIEDENDEFEDEDEDIEDENDERVRRVWGDEIVEKKKINAGFQAYLDKQKKNKKDDKEDKKKDEKDDKSIKGLTAKQKKLPIALQKSILAKKKK